MNWSTRTGAAAVGIALATGWTLSPIFKSTVLPPPPASRTAVTSEGVLITDFGDLSVWAYDASAPEEEGGSIVLDYDSFDGTAIRLTTPNPPNSAAWMTLSGLNLDISKSGTFSFWLNVSDPKRIETISFYLNANDDAGRYLATSIDMRGIPAGRQMMAIGIPELKPFGGMTTNDLVTSIQLRIESTIGTGSVAFDNLYYGRVTTPKVVISFDDNWLTQFTEAFPYMAQRGIPGTIFAIKNMVGTRGYMNLEQLKIVYAAGWDVGNHTVDHVGFNSYEDQKEFPFGRSLATIASRQIPAKSFALNGSLATNGKVSLNRPRTIVFRAEQYLESTERNWVIVEGTGADGGALRETVPLSDAPWITTNSAFATIADLKIVRPAGGYITVGVSQSAEAVARSLMECTAYLIANGMPRAAYHVAYPLGEQNVVSDRVLNSLNYRTGRTVSGRTTVVSDGLLNPLAIQALAPNSATSLESAKEAVDQAIVHGASVHIVLHRLEASEKVSTDWSVSKFRALIDYVSQKRDAGLIEPNTISSWYDSLPSPQVSKESGSSSVMRKYEDRLGTVGVGRSN